VAFEKCIIAIRDNAFINSEYPVCVTLEDHLTSALQAKAAEVRDFSEMRLLFLSFDIPFLRSFLTSLGINEPRKDTRFFLCTILSSC